MSEIMLSELIKILNGILEKEGDLPCRCASSYDGHAYPMTEEMLTVDNRELIIDGDGSSKNGKEITNIAFP